MFTLVDIAGIATGSLLDPVVWIVSGFLAYRFGLKWILIAAAAGGFASEALGWLVDEIGRDGYFTGLRIAGRCLAGFVAGMVVLAILAARRKMVRTETP